MLCDNYKKYKLAAGKTAKSILISCGARLAPFDIAELRELTSYDEMELDMLGDQRTAMLSLSLIRMIPSILLLRLCTRSFLTCYVTGQMMYMEEDYLTMYVCF